MTASDLDSIRRHFRADTPKQPVAAPVEDRLAGRIAGATALTMRFASDHRGDLVELLTTRDHAIEPIVHVYQVFCAPGSVRAWVYHEHQDDRLCFTTGRFKVVLFDLRSTSATAGALVTLLVGADAPTLIRIPSLVAHGVQNLGETTAAFVNLPTNVYCHHTPDKHRLPADSPLIPYIW